MKSLALIDIVPHLDPVRVVQLCEGILGPCSSQGAVFDLEESSIPAVMILDKLTMQEMATVAHMIGAWTRAWPRLNRSQRIGHLLERGRKN